MHILHLKCKCTETETSGDGVWERDYGYDSIMEVIIRIGRLRYSCVSFFLWSIHVARYMLVWFPDPSPI